MTEKGFQWLEKECGMVIHTKTRPEKEYLLNEDDEEILEQVSKCLGWDNE